MNRRSIPSAERDCLLLQQELMRGGVARKSAQAHVQSGKGEEICIVFDLEGQVGQVDFRYAAAIRPIMGVIQRSSSYHHQTACVRLKLNRAERPLLASATVSELSECLPSIHPRQIAILQHFPFLLTAKTSGKM